MKEARVLAANGMLGTGLKKDSLKRGLDLNPHVIGCDAGSTDPGPYFLATGEMHFSTNALRHDLKLMIEAARSRKIPLIIGSAGTGGTDVHLCDLAGIVKKIAAEEGLHFRLGLIHSEQNKEYLVSMLQKGKIKPLRNAPALTAERIMNSLHIVGMAGVEPFIECLDNGAEVIIAGRSSDTSIYAAVPIKMGLPPGPVWHAAKTIECGTACTEKLKYSDSMFVSIDEAGFTVEPPNPDFMCTPLSVASHMLYENASPYELIEPSGILDTRAATYKALDSRSVRVEGSSFKHKKFDIKLEGAELTGYQYITIGGVRDPIILRQLDSWLEGMNRAITERFGQIFGITVHEKYRLNFRVFGRNGTMGKLEPDNSIGHEVGIVIEVVAETKELAHALSATANHTAVHYPVPEWVGVLTGLAFPYSPAEIYRGPLYQFNMNHVVEPDRYQDMFKVEYENI